MLPVPHLLKDFSTTSWKQRKHINSRKTRWTWFSMMSPLTHRLWFRCKGRMSELQRKTINFIMKSLLWKKKEIIVNWSGNLHLGSCRRNAKISSFWWIPKTTASESWIKMLPHSKCRCRIRWKRFIIRLQIKLLMGFPSLTIELPQTCLALMNKAWTHLIFCKKTSTRTICRMLSMLDSSPKMEL